MLDCTRDSLAGKPKRRNYMFTLLGADDYSFWAIVQETYDDLSFLDYISDKVGLQFRFLALRKLIVRVEHVPLEESCQTIFPVLW